MGHLFCAVTLLVTYFQRPRCLPPAACHLLYHGLFCIPTCCGLYLPYTCSPLAAGFHYLSLPTYLPLPCLRLTLCHHAPSRFARLCGLPALPGATPTPLAAWHGYVALPTTAYFYSRAACGSLRMDYAPPDLPFGRIFPLGSLHRPDRRAYLWYLGSAAATTLRAPPSTAHPFLLPLNLFVCLACTSTSTHVAFWRPLDGYARLAFTPLPPAYRARAPFGCGGCVLLPRRS